MISKEKEKEIKKFLVNVWHKKLYDSDERADYKFGYKYLARKYWKDEFEKAKSEGYSLQVHHIDFNHDNNVVSNLVILTRSEHAKIHYLFDPKYDERNKKISKTMTGTYRGPLSEETKRKIGEKARNCSAEARRKMSEARKGKPLSEETRRKISEAQKGKPKHLTEMSRRKMSEARKKYWAERKAQRTQER